MFALLYLNVHEYMSINLTVGYLVGWLVGWLVETGSHLAVQPRQVVSDQNDLPV